MAQKTKGIGVSEWQPVRHKHRTSIGASVQTRPSNKAKRRSFKKYRGQGR